MTRSLITGLEGFVADWLVRELLDHNREILATWFIEKDLRDPFQLHDRIQRCFLDIRDIDAVRKVLADFQPDEVYHLAGISAIPYAETHPALTWEVNTLAVAGLLQACCELPTPPRVLLIGSGAMYGATAREHAVLKEEHPLRPANVYGMTKAAQELLGIQFFESRNLPVYLARAFNHTGPGQREDFVLSSFARQVARISLGKELGPVRVGNLQSRRDFHSVEDTVRAYRMLLESPHAGRPFNISSGAGTRVGDVLEHYLQLAGTPITVEPDPSRIRPGEVPLIVGDPSAIRDAVGWEVRVPLERLLDDLYAVALEEAR